MKVVHVTSVHPRYDTRIFLKMCSSLSGWGLDTTLVVADGGGDEIKNGVKIIDAGPKTGGRLSRMTKTARRVYATAKEVTADVYHLHDPELMPMGVKLVKKGCKVIFDVHEDFPEDILSGKPYLNNLSAWTLSKFMAVYEKRCCKRYSAVVAATQSIYDKLKNINIKTVNVNNYPIIDELAPGTTAPIKQTQVCYVGGIVGIRGIIEMVDSMELVRSSVKLQLVGKFIDDNLRNDTMNRPGWSNVEEQGVLDRLQVKEILNTSLAGLVLFLPVPNHTASQPNKMYEYMSSAIPIIASNFPLWREIVEGNKCGICVDPTKPSEIAAAIDYFVENPSVAKEMGENGRQAVINTYNWETEKNKLFDLYRSLEEEIAKKSGGF